MNEDSDALRQRIADRLHAQLPGCEHDEHGANCEALADAVLAEPAPPADRAAVLREAAAAVDALDPVEAVLAGKYAFHDVATSLYHMANEAEFVATPCDSMVPCEDGGEPCHTHERLMSHYDGSHELCEPGCATAELRRRADETQPTTETPGSDRVVAHVLATHTPTSTAYAAPRRHTETSGRPSPPRSWRTAACAPAVVPTC